VSQGIEHVKRRQSWPNQICVPARGAGNGGHPICISLSTENTSVNPVWTQDFHLFSSSGGCWTGKYPTRLFVMR
jgi:hypothetical protein